MSRDRRDGSKLTFAERDRLRREGRGGRRDSRGGRPGDNPSHAQKSYRAALERAFADGRVAEFAATMNRRPDPRPVAPPPRPEPVAARSVEAAESDAATVAQPAVDSAQVKVDRELKERRKLMSEVKKAEGRDAITKAVDRCRRKLGTLPNDWEVLEQALLHKDDDVVLETIGQLEVMLSRDKPRRSRSLAAQLRLLEDTHDVREVRDRAAALRAAL